MAGGNGLAQRARQQVLDRELGADASTHDAAARLGLPFDLLQQARAAHAGGQAPPRALARGLRLARKAGGGRHEHLGRDDQPAELVGNAPKMRALARTIHSLRRNESHVLITGESGTGKELVARAVHAASPRADGELVPVES